MAGLLESVLTIETFFNVVVFVFIGLMIWLYFKDTKEDEDSE